MHVALAAVLHSCFVCACSISAELAVSGLVAQAVLGPVRAFVKEIQAGGPVSKHSGEGGEPAETPQPAKAAMKKAADQRVCGPPLCCTQAVRLKLVVRSGHAQPAVWRAVKGV